jgi:hypothetical protein
MVIYNKYTFDISDSNTDDRPLRRTLHLSVLYSARVRQFTQNTERSEVEGLRFVEYIASN